MGVYYDGNMDQTLVEHWDGTAWSVVSSPNPGSTDNLLGGVAALTGSQIWAVGSHLRQGGPNYHYFSETLVEHWNGAAWSVVPSPSGNGVQSSILNGVAAVSVSDVWAVGYYSTGWDTDQTLVEHWNGTEWSVVPSPDPAATLGYLYGVAAISASGVWAVGYYDYYGTLVKHWNGTVWYEMPSPNQGTGFNYLLGVAAVSANNLWAVGYYYDDGTCYTLIEHWDGTAWSVVPSPGPAASYNALSAITAVSANDVWAVGSYRNQGGANRTLVEHWDGSAWSVVTSPKPGTYASSLSDVAAVSTGNLWAVGEYNSQPLVEHWDGSAWSVVTSPNAGTNYSRLHGVVAVPAVPGDNVWAVGSYNKEGSTWTLVERFIPCSACTVQYTDVPSGSAFYDYVHCLACRSIVSGYADGTFRPNNPVTRGQLTKIVSNSANHLETFTTNTFQDVPTGSTFFPYIERLYFHGGIGGYACGNPEPCLPPDNKPYFRPGTYVTRGQTSKIVAIARQLPAPSPGQQTFEDVAPNSTFWQWIEPLAASGAIGGYPCGGEGEPCLPPGNRPYFRPGASVTRGQSAKIVSNASFPECVSPASK